MPQQSKDKTRSKPRFLDRIIDRGVEAARVARLLLVEPRSFPGELGRAFRRAVRGLWHARGGGLYACGFVVTFLWLEATTLVAEVTGAASLGAFFGEQLLQFVFRFTIQSLVNTIGAFLWPAYLLQVSPLWGAAALAALYVVFPRYLKEPLTRWLFNDDEAEVRPRQDTEPW